MTFLEPGSAFAFVWHGAKPLHVIPDATTLEIAYHSRRAESVFWAEQVLGSVDALREDVRLIVDEIVRAISASRH